ncbi:unnamed protein product [Anisakis simplex]|uniref:Adenylate cyclase type 2 n=1 Tax=Anisakis simplex TaxID=6269 RepID=A0A0M3J1L7_ANISI|nr:unnamed protein product [Anisakis simplex]
MGQRVLNRPENGLTDSEQNNSEETSKVSDEKRKSDANGRIGTGANCNDPGPSTSAPNQSQNANQSKINIVTKAFKLFRKNKVSPENAEASVFMNRFGLNNSKHTSRADAEAHGETESNGNRFEYLLKKHVVDTKDEFYYYWLGVVSCAFTYNLIVVIARSVFKDLAAGLLWILWAILDVVADSIYLFDMFIRSRTG